MPTLESNGIQLEYDTFGDRSGRPLLLIMGLGAQMILWDEEFCEALAARGHWVVRFDNRDVGLSTKFDEAGVPNVLELMQRTAAGEPVFTPYTLDEMADDAAGLLDALELDSAHVCGASMGGMIAQTVAIRHPERLRSLVSIMSTTGDPDLPPARPDAMVILMTPPPSDRAGSIERAVTTWKTIGSPGFAFDETRIRERAGRLYDRCFHPAGVSRQLAAILAHGSRSEALGGVTVPTLVVHGDADPLVPVEGGRDTAKRIPGAELLVIEGMGHDLPPALWPRLADAISEHTAKASSG
ncbi:MAG: alpha/beta fold hydrolase [Myxococcota bacterium]